MMMIWYLIEWQLTMMITMEIPTLEIRTSRFLISFCSKVTNIILILNLCHMLLFLYLLPEKYELELVNM